MALDTQKFKIALNYLESQGDGRITDIPQEARYIDPPNYQIVDIRDNTAQTFTEVEVDTAYVLVLSESEEINAREIVLEKAKNYLNTQLMKSNPDTDAIYSTLKNNIDTRPSLTTMMDNIIALEILATGWVQGSHTALENKRFYIRCFMILVGILG